MPFQSESKYVALKRNLPSSQSERSPISVLSMTSAGSGILARVASTRVPPAGTTEFGPIVTTGSPASVKPSA